MSQQSDEGQLNEEQRARETFHGYTLAQIRQMDVWFRSRNLSWQILDEHLRRGYELGRVAGLQMGREEKDKEVAELRKDQEAFMAAIEELALHPQLAGTPYFFVKGDEVTQVEADKVEGIFRAIKTHAKALRPQVENCWGREAKIEIELQAEREKGKALVLAGDALASVTECFCDDLTAYKGTCETCLWKAEVEAYRKASRGKNG